MIGPSGALRPDNTGLDPSGPLGRKLTDDLLFRVLKPGQYLGNEWGSAQKNFAAAQSHLCLAFPDMYELGMSNFGLRILYQLVNANPLFMCDRTYAPGSDLEELMRQENVPLWGWESRRALCEFELIGFSLAYELTYTNVLNMLQLSGLPVVASERQSLFPLIFGGGPASVNPEPMSLFMDFFIIGDGEESVPSVMELVRQFKADLPKRTEPAAVLKKELLYRIASEVKGAYVPAFYETRDGVAAVPTVEGIPARVPRQVVALDDQNQPTKGIVPYLATVHDRQVLEVRRGCDRGCRFCQPGYTFLPVRERSADDLVKLSKEALDNSGYQEYSLLSLCVSDYTSLHDAVRQLNREHSSQRASMSFPSQRADRMNFDIAEELKAVRKSGITLAPEAGTERLRAVINKGLNHEQIISAIESAYASGWSAVKLYFMIGLPTEVDEDLDGIVNILKEARDRCRAMRKKNPQSAPKRDMEFTCTLSNFVPKPFTPFQWFGQFRPEEFRRKQKYLKEKVKEAKLFTVQLNFTEPQISLLESVISRGDRKVGEMILRTWQKGAKFDAWDERFQPELWHQSAAELNLSLEDLSCLDREVGSEQPWDVINVGLANWWLVNEWKKAQAVKETAPCSENTCHACGICTDLQTTHVLASPKETVLGKNPFVKPIATAPAKEDLHPSLFFQKPAEPPPNKVQTRILFEFTKTGDLKFISHLDVQHLFQRAARRARIALAYTEGFNPSPKLALALSLALYTEGLAEVGDVELAEVLSADEFKSRLNSQLPAEIQITRAREIAQNKTVPAQMVDRAMYRATLHGDSGRIDVQTKVSQLLEATNLVIEVAPSKSQRKNKGRTEAAEPSTRDIRPGIHSLVVTGEFPVTVEMELAHGPRLHVKPTDILKLLREDGDWRMVRIGLKTEDGTSLFDRF